MIIQNGTIEIKIKSGGGIDAATGYPIAATYEWSSPIPCQYIPNSRNNLGKTNGEHFTIATYEVLIEAQPFKAEQIRLKNMKGEEIGEFSVIGTEYYQAVQEIKITI